MMKFYLFCLISIALEILSAGEKIYLNPSTPIGIFRRNSGLWHQAASRLSLSYSAKGLQLDALLTVPPGKTFKATWTPGNESSVFGGEVFEFQIAPNGQNGIYYHFAINPSGHMYTARCRDFKWNPVGTILENRVSGTEWQFRLIIPYYDLNTTQPKAGEVWRVNLARSDISSGSTPINSSHSGALDYHAVSQYSEVVFGRYAPADCSILMQNVKLTEDFLQFEFITRLRQRFPLRCEIYYDGNLCCACDAVMENGFSSIQVRNSFPYMPLKIGIPARVVLKHAENGKVLFQSEGYFSFSPKNLQLDRFYYTMADSEIRFQHELSGRCIVRLYDSSGKIVRTVSFGNSIALSGLSPGRYILEAANERVVSARVLFLLDGPPILGPLPAGQALTVSNGRLELGGKPIYLLGLSITPKSFLQFPIAFNLSYNRAGVRKNAVRLYELPGGRPIRNPFDGRFFPPDQEYQKRLVTFVRKKQTDQMPGLWRISYEAQIPMAVRNAEGNLIPANTRDLMYKIYQTVKKANPDLIYSIQTNLSRVKDFAPACDVLETASWTSSYAVEMMPDLQRDMLQIKRNTTSGKPIIFWLGGTIPNKRCRLAEEIRAAVYLSVLHGFSGNIIHMGHGFLPSERSRLWSLLSGIHAEIESFYSTWASGKEIPIKIPKSFAGKAVQTSSGEILLLAVNLNPYDTFFCCSLPSIPQNERFTAYEPKLYRVKPLIQRHGNM